MINLEVIYLTRDNTSEVQLTQDGEPISTGPFTKMTLTFGPYLVESTNLATDPIRWGVSGYDVGEVRFKLGGLIGISPADYPKVPFVLYSADYPDGIVWSFLRFLAEEV